MEDKKDKKQNNIDVSSYGDPHKPHVLDGANAAVDPFKPGELDKDDAGLTNYLDDDEFKEANGRKQ